MFYLAFEDNAGISNFILEYKCFLVNSYYTGCLGRIIILNRKKEICFDKLAGWIYHAKI